MSLLPRQVLRDRRSGEVFVTYNATIVPPRLHRLQHIRWPEDCVTPSTENNKHPFLAFVPVSPSYQHVLFRRLSYPMDHFPIHEDEYGFSLRSDVQQRWASLETGLKLVTDALIILLPDVSATFPLDFSYFRFPTQYGYLLRHSTRRDAIKKIRNSRNAFIMLGSMCSYIIALHGDPALHFPSWAMQLIDRFHVHPQWIEDFLTSWICDFSIRRVGAFIDLARCAYGNQLNIFLKLGIPLWML